LLTLDELLCFAGGEGLSGLSVCVRALLRERADNVLKQMIVLIV
jgi:hypothetical protein